MVPYLVVPVILALKTLLAAGAVAVILAVLSFSRIRQWLRKRSGLIEEDPRRVRVSVHERMKNGEYRTVYGIFDPVHREFVEAEIAESGEIDEELRRIHRDSPVVEYR